MTIQPPSQILHKKQTKKQQPTKQTNKQKNLTTARRLLKRLCPVNALKRISYCHNLPLQKKKKKKKINK